MDSNNNDSHNNDSHPSESDDLDPSLFSILSMFLPSFQEEEEEEVLSGIQRIQMHDNSDDNETNSKASEKEKKKEKAPDVSHNFKKDKGNFDEAIFNSLYQSFYEDPQKAIEKSKEYFNGQTYSTFEEFLEEIKKTQKFKCCTFSSETSTIYGYCFDCSLSKSSCLCTSCFFSGNHDNHQSYLFTTKGAANCDCGDSNFMKEETNCPHHSHYSKHPEIDQLTSENRKKFITVFQAAFLGAFMNHVDIESSVIFDWIKNLVQFGDGIRRCCSISISSLSSKFFFTELMNLGKKSVDSLIELFRSLLSDFYFSRKMGSTILYNYLTLLKKMQKNILDDEYNKERKPFYVIKKFTQFSSHFFNANSLLYLVNEKKFNWVDFCISALEIILETVVQMPSGKNYHDIVNQIILINQLLKILLTIDEQHSNLQKFIDKYSELLIKYEAKFSFCYCDFFNDDPKTTIYRILLLRIYYLNSLFSLDFNSSEKNKKFLINEVFSNLADFLKSENDIECNPIYSLEERVPICYFLPIHHLFYCLVSSYPNVPEIISINCQKNDIKLNDFCIKASILPLRILVLMYAPERFSNSQDAKYIIQIFEQNPKITFNKFFGLYQTLLGVSTDKNVMLSFIMLTFSCFINICATIDYFRKNDMNIFCIYDIKHNQEVINKFAYSDSAIFIMSVLTDRSIINFDDDLFRKQQIMELLRVRGCEIYDIESHINTRINNSKLEDELLTIADTMRLDDGSIFVLKNINDLQPFFPFMSHENHINIISAYRNKLIPIPMNDLPRGLSFDGCFRSIPIIFLIYECLTFDEYFFSTQIGLLMFILAMTDGKIYDKNSFNPENPPVIDSDDIFKIYLGIKKIIKDENVNFSTIQIKFNGEQKSILELVKSKGFLGEEAINKSKIPISFESTDKYKFDVKSFKEKIIKVYDKRKRSFIKAFAKIESKIDSFECPICHNNDDKNKILCYPCISVPSIYPSLINNKLHNKNESYEKVFNLSICNHPAHYECYKGSNDSSGYCQCKVDNCERNCFLPKFSDKEDDFNLNYSEQMKEIVDDFINNAFNLSESKDDKIPINSFVGIVSLLEVRHRSRPECFDYSNSSLLLHNFLLSLYYKYHNSQIDIKSNDPLFNLVLLIIKSNSPINDFKNIVKNISKDLDKEYFYEFLRRCSIIEEFAIKRRKDDEKIVDWDEILSFDFLLSHFDMSDLKSKLIKLPLFEPFKLPQKFTDFYRPPFNVDIFDSSVTMCIDLLTGEIVVLENCDGKKQYKTVSEYNENVYLGCPMLILFLTGYNSTKIAVYSSVGYKISNLNAIYVDRFGSSDPGFRRGVILRISQDKLDNAIDRLLYDIFMIDLKI